MIRDVYQTTRRGLLGLMAFLPAAARGEDDMGLTLNKKVKQLNLVGRGARGPAGIDHMSPENQRPGRLLQYAAGGAGRRVVAVEAATPANAVAATSLAASGGAAMVGYSGRGLVDRLQDTLSVKDFGITGNAAGDLGAVLQWIHDNKLGPNGGIIEIPAAFSNYPIVAPAVFTKPVLLRGGAHRGCSIVCRTGNIVCLSFSNWFAVEGLEFTLIGDAAASSIAIKGLAASNGHNGSRVIHTRITGGKIGIHHERANEMRLHDVTLGSYTSYGVLLENNTNSDEGDNHVSDCTFAGGANSNVIGLYVKDAGIYGVNNKANGAHATAVLVEASTGDVGNVNWHGGSLEGVFGSTFRIQTSGGHLFTKAQIIGVQMSSDADCHLDLSAGRIRNVVAVGNIMNGSAAKTTGVRIGADARVGLIGSNEFYTLRKAIEISPGSGGWAVDTSNRFADDVGAIYTGPSGIVPTNPPMASDIRLSLDRYMDVLSASSWTNVFSWKGMGEFRFQIGAVVQGSGVGTVFGRGYFSDAQTEDMTVKMIPAAAIVDAQVVPNGGGGSTLQVKKHTTAGDAANLTIKLELIGAPDAVLRA